MRAAVAMGADIDHEGAIRHFYLIRAEQEQHVERTEGRHLCEVEAAFARRKADIERARARSRILQHGKAVPAVLERACACRDLGRQRQRRRAIMPRKRAGADQHDRMLGAL